MEIKSRRIVKFQIVAEGKRTASQILRKSSTNAESHLWSHLRGSSLTVKFRRQQVIKGFIVDFYCDSLGLVVEVDGSVHLENPEKDLERDSILSSYGLTLLHLKNADVLVNIDAVLNEIRKVVELLTTQKSISQVDKSM